MSGLRLITATLVLALAGCASGGPSERSANPRPDRDRLTAEELDAHPQTNLLEAVKLLRPHWRGTVYVDGYPVGGMEELRRLTTKAARSVEYLRAADAAGRFGLALQGGGPVIVVTSR